MFTPFGSGFLVLTKYITLTRNSGSNFKRMIRYQLVFIIYRLFIVLYLDDEKTQECNK